MAQRSPIRSFLSVVPSNVSVNTPVPNVNNQSQLSSVQASSPQSVRKTIQFPNMDSASGTRSSVKGSSKRTVRSRGVKLPQPIPNIEQSRRSNVLLDPRINSSIGGDRRGTTDGHKRSPMLASTREGFKHRSEPLRPTSRMSNRQSQSSDKPIPSSSSQKSPSARSRNESRSRSTQKHSPVANRRRSRDKRSNPTRQKRLSPVLSCVRLFILGIGLAAIAGTLLSLRDPARQKTAVQASASGVATSVETSRTNVRLNPPTVLPLGQEIRQLKHEIQSLTTSYSQMTPGIFLVDLDNGAYLDMNANNTFSAASTIKVPILIALFQEVDAGNIRLDERLTMHSEYIAGGSGDMQYQAVNSEYTVLETAKKMITISDNTATNMLIARLGGENILNQRFQSWGLTSTRIQNFLPDIKGTNTTSPKDLVYLMAMVEKGGLLSLRSRDRILDIMQSTENNTLLPQGLGHGATIAHKTGNIGSVLADTGIIDMPNGKRYLASIMVKRPHDDPDAEELIRQISQAAYKSFKGERGIARHIQNQ